MTAVELNQITRNSEGEDHNTGGPARPYGGLSRLYDYEYAGFDSDIYFYLERLRTTRIHGLILDLGAGTGRVALALARAGYFVVGLDNSPAMLRRARGNRRRLAGEAALRVKFSQQDMTGFRFRRSFAAAIISFSTLAMLTAPEQRLSCLTRIHEHLEPGGMLFIDLFAPLSRPRPNQDQPRLTNRSFHLPPYGHLVEKKVEERRNQQNKTIDVTYHYRKKRYRGEKILGEFTISFILADLTFTDVEAALEKSGFDVEEVHGDYQGCPFGPASPRMIFEARRR